MTSHLKSLAHPGWLWIWAAFAVVVFVLGVLAGVSLIQDGLTIGASFPENLRHS